MATELTRWLPIELLIGPTDFSVRWIEGPPGAFRDPFFFQTLQRLRRQRPPARERITTLDELFSQAERYPPIAPAGVICHVSRCGSTHVANVLKQAPGVMVLSECKLMATLLIDHSIRRVPPGVVWSADVRRHVLDAVIRLYGFSTDTDHPKVIIKCHSATMLHIGDVLASLPETPCLVMIRDPLEVMVSNLRTPGGWVRSQHQALGTTSIFGWTADDCQRMSCEEYCARGFASFCDAVRPHIGPRCRVLDYSHLSLDVIYDVARWFGLTMPPAESGQIARVCAAYSKDPTMRRPFETDTTDKHRDVDDVMRGAAEQWATAPYQSLRHLDVWSRQGALLERVH